MFIVMFVCLISSLGENASIDIELESYQYSLKDVAVDNNYYYVSFSKNQRGTENTLVKVDVHGSVEEIFERNGQGPGELRNVRGLAVVGDKIAVSEGISRLVHLYDKDLRFVMDIKTELGGEIFALSGNRFGIWNTHRGGENTTHMLRIYALESRAIDAPPTYAVEIPTDRIPLFIQAWGGIDQTSDGGFVAIRSSKYQMEKYDINGELEQVLIQEPPSHFTPYEPYSGDPRVVNKEAREWMQTFSKLYGVFCIGDWFGIYYINGRDEGFLDLLDQKGRFVARKIPFPNTPILWRGESFLSVRRKETERGDFTFSIVWESLSNFIDR